VPSASSSRITVASVNGRLPDIAFSSVDRLSLAVSARPWREMRRRAISSRTRSATVSLSKVACTPKWPMHRSCSVAVLHKTVQSCTLFPNSPAQWLKLVILSRGGALFCRSNRYPF
jgi:hypothetical protein